MNSLMPVRHLPQSHPAWEVPPTPSSWLIAAAAGTGAGAARAGVMRAAGLDVRGAAQTHAEVHA